MNNIVPKIKMKGAKLAVLLTSGIVFFAQSSLFAQEKSAPSEMLSMFSNPVFMTLLGVIILLLIIIAVMADVVKAAASHKREQDRAKKNNSVATKTAMLTILVIGSSSALFAQDGAAVANTTDSYFGVGEFVFYLMLTIIAFEVFVIWSMYNVLMNLLGVKERMAALAVEKKLKPSTEPTFIDKFNASVSIEKESDILLDHNYDGIQELDNNLPPWWKYGFYLTIVFAFIYLIHFHISNTGKLQLAEYDEQLKQAKADLDEYHKKAANLVDENNATLLTDEASLNAGKSIFLDNCAACHGKLAEGGVGPNLTDDYWIHQGGIKDIFRSVKLGWPDKGMKSWQMDLGAKQIHEVSSYIKSLRGTNPPNGKDKQGELYTEGAAVATDSASAAVVDSAKVVVDSTQVVKK